MKNSNLAKNAVLKLVKSLTGVYKISPYIGNEIIVTMDNLDKIYVNFTYNDNYSKIKLSTQFGLIELNNYIIEL